MDDRSRNILIKRYGYSEDSELRILKSLDGKNIIDGNIEITTNDSMMFGRIEVSDINVQVKDGRFCIKDMNGKAERIIVNIKLSEIKNLIYKSVKDAELIIICEICKINYKMEIIF